MIVLSLDRLAQSQNTIPAPSNKSKVTQSVGLGWVEPYSKGPLIAKIITKVSSVRSPEQQTFLKDFLQLCELSITGRN